MAGRTAGQPLLVLDAGGFESRVDIYRSSMHGEYSRFFHFIYGNRRAIGKYTLSNCFGFAVGPFRAVDA